MKELLRVMLFPRGALARSFALSPGILMAGWVAKRQGGIFDATWFSMYSPRLDRWTELIWNEECV